MRYKSKTKKNRKLFGGSLREFYGEMILKKNTILYHSDDNKFSIKPEKPMLFLTFHPRDWQGKYTTRIKLRRDISLFFMVNPDVSWGSSISPLLNTLTKKKGRNLNKQLNSNLKCYIPYLINENFDGWFSTIEGRTTVEIALINNLDSYDIISSELHNNTNYEYGGYNHNNNTLFIPAKYGDKYPIHTEVFPIKLILNYRYKEFINSYKEHSIQSHYEFPFQIVLKNAEIEYVKKEYNDIFWDC
jgi:hypothetical protein